MHPHRSSALDGAAATLTVARTRGVAVPLSWSWSHHPQGRAWADALARVDTFFRPYPVTCNEYTNVSPGAHGNYIFNCSGFRVLRTLRAPGY